MATFRTAAIVIVIVGFVLGMLLGMSAGADATQPGVALAADSSMSGVLQSLAQTVAKPLMKALNGGAGVNVKIVDPSAKGDLKSGTTPKQGQNGQRATKP